VRENRLRTRRKGVGKAMPHVRPVGGIGAATPTRGVRDSTPPEARGVAGELRTLIRPLAPAKDAKPRHGLPELRHPRPDSRLQRTAHITSHRDS
jgi:hypothetical protein